ncbi:MAG: ice-binding family protein [Candidatus Acidiferrales bacterium]
MRNFKVFQISILAFFLAVVISGCGDPDRAAPGPGSPLAPPAVVSASVLPPNGSSGICPNTVVTAIFDKAMNPATINTTTFTLASSGGSVTGVVTYDPTTNTATFTPASPGLAVSTVYTATITTGAKDQFGNGLAADFSWMFTTAAAACAGPPAVPLLTAGNFKVLAGSTVTSTTTPPGTTITGGDLGLSPGTSVTGFPPGTLTPPAVMHVADATAAQAQLDLTAAYNYAAGIVLPAPASLPGDLTGLTLTEGTYKTSSSTGILTVGATLTLTGNSSSVFVFQIGSTLTTLASTQVVLTGGVLPSNVFWQVGSSATLGTNSVFVGNIMALASITLDTSATLQGRALARNGAVTLDDNTIFDP